LDQKQTKRKELEINFQSQNIHKSPLIRAFIV
jgi:hypothetical protein